MSLRLSSGSKSGNNTGSSKSYKNRFLSVFRTGAVSLSSVELEELCPSTGLKSFTEGSVVTALRYVAVLSRISCYILPKNSAGYLALMAFTLNLAP